MYTLNLSTQLMEASRQAPDKTFLLAGLGQSRTYGQLYEDAGRFATLLENMGIQPGETVALLAGNTIEAITCYFGALMHGAVVAPILPMWPGPEVAYVLGDTQAAVLVAWEPLLPNALAGFEQARPVCRHLVVINLPGSSVCPEGCERLSDGLVDLAAKRYPALTRPDDPAVIIYTSGSTGRPKGALISHFNLISTSMVLASDFWQVDESDILLMAAALGNIFGQALLHTACRVRAGLSLVSKPDLDILLQAIERDRATFFAGVSPLASLLLHSPAARGRDLSSLRKAMFSGSPISPEVVMEFRERFNIPVILGYGSTEGVPMVYINAAQAESAPPGSVGRPSWGTLVRVVDESGQDVPAGGMGEIIVRGPQILLGYLNQPDANQQAFRDGWYHSGDMGQFDGDGYLFIVGRLKEMLKVEGYAVAPAEVELALAAHPAVAEAAVIGVQHSELSERIKAFIVLKPGAAVETAEIIAFCRQRLPDYKCPRWVVVLPAMPRGATGKTNKQALKEL